MNIIYQNKVSKPFLEKVVFISKKLNFDPNWLMAVMNFESAGTFSPKIKNKFGYVGLIQFGKEAALDLNVTLDKLSKMHEIEQLDYVYRYYLPYKSKIKSYVDLYLATLFPVSIGKESNYILQTKKIPAYRVASRNPIFDLNMDQKITVGEVEKRMILQLPLKWRSVLKKKH